MKTELDIIASRKLINAGVPISYASKQNYVEKIGDNIRGIVKKENPDPIFTLDDLINLVPKKINVHVGSQKYQYYYLNIRYISDKEIQVYYTYKDSVRAMTNGYELIERFYQIIMYCIENNFLTFNNK